MYTGTYFSWKFLNNLSQSLDQGPKERVTFITEMKHGYGSRNSVFKNLHRLEYAQNNINVYLTSIYVDP